MPITTEALASRIEDLINAEIHGLDDFAKVNKITELIEVFSRDVPAMLAEMRVQHVRRLVEVYTAEEIQNGTRISPSRMRKLLER
jgi:hypothetical protein